MRINFYIFSFVCLIMLVSCSEEPTNDKNSGINDLNRYFPLIVGNEWVYIRSRDTSEIIQRVEGIKRLMGEDYFVFKQYNIKTGEVDTNYFKYDSVGDLYYFSTIYDTSYLHINFSKTKPENLKSSSGSIIRENFTDTVMAGIFHNCKEVEFIPFSQWSYYVVYAPNVGMIRSTRMMLISDEMELKKAKINGRIYQ